MRKILLVGSVGFDDAETVFTHLANSIAPYTPRFTDGEVPPRNHWMMWQRDVFDRGPEFELDSSKEVFFGGKQQSFEKFKIKPEFESQAITIGELGYAREAIKSYQLFCELRERGVIPEGIRFQMSLPSAVAVCSQHITSEHQALVEPYYEQALQREVALMLKDIPADDFAIQWDICQEVLAIDGAWPLYYEDLTAGAIERMKRLSDFVPEPCELGFHLCYGDPGHKHIKEPENLGVCVTLANDLCNNNTRQVNWIHMPIPRERTDDEYFSPMKNLKLQPNTELFLGLVHLTDGVGGAQKRMDTAMKYRTDFGIATECGFGRRPVETLQDLLQLHADVAKM